MPNDFMIRISFQLGLERPHLSEVALMQTYSRLSGSGNTVRLRVLTPQAEQT